MKRKVIVLGSRGMLGHMLFDVLGRDPRINALGISKHSKECGSFFNVEKGIEWLDRLRRTKGKFDYIINCIGITSSQIDENDPESVRRAMVINGFFPQELAQWAQNHGTRVLSISSDGVFKNNGGQFFEDSLISPEDTYGKTKALGEVVSAMALNIRCSIIGPSPHNYRNLYAWFHQQPENFVIKGYINHLWNGVTTLEYAEFCHQIILFDLFEKLREQNHVFHFASRPATSKFDLLHILKKISGKQLDITPVGMGEKMKGRILKSKHQVIKPFLPKKTLEEALRMFYKKNK